MWELNELPDDDEVIVPPEKPKYHFPKPAPARPANYKLDIIKVYQAVFEGISIDNLMIKPILMPKNTLMGRIEQIYDKQAEIFLKKRSFKDFDFPRTVREVMREKFGQSTIYSYQALFNLLYSINKYQEPEVKVFSDFVLKAQDNHRLAYYLFLRQFTKVVGHVSFIAHHKSISDPYKLTLSGETCIQIIRSAFFSDDYLYVIVLDQLRDVLENRKSLTYYEFLVTVYSTELEYKSLPLEDILASLYTPKKPGETNRIVMNFTDVLSVKRQPVKALAEENQDHTNSQKGDEAELEKDEAAKLAAMEQNEKDFFRNVKNELQDFARFFTVTYLNEKDIVSTVSNTKFEGVVQQLYKKLYHITVVIFLSNKKKFLKLMRSKSDSDSQLEEFWLEISELTSRLKKVDASNSSATDFLNALMKFEPLRMKMNFFLEFQLETDIDELLKPNKLLTLN